MTSEGMVHALEQIHRLLKPAGVLVDIHPLAEAPLVEVHQGGRILFSELNPGDCAEECRQADAALAQAVQRRMFALERSGQFEYLVYGSSVNELLDYLAQANVFASEGATGDEAESALDGGLVARLEGVMQAAGAGAQVATHERIHISRLRPV